MLLENKFGINFGVANKRSIAWAIAQSTAGQGAQLLFNYQNERLKQNVEELAATLPGAKAFPCDVSNDGEIASLMQQVQMEIGQIDFLVHSLAFAPREELSGQFARLAAPIVAQGMARGFLSFIAPPSAFSEFDAHLIERGAAACALELQEAMQRENREYTALSNVMKVKHDSAKAAINNIH